MGFFDELQQSTASERATLLAAPIIQDALSGRIRLHQYVAFLSQAYHHVRHTVPLLMACGSRLDARLGWLRSATAEYIAEENGHALDLPALRRRATRLGAPGLPAPRTASPSAPGAPGLAS